MVAKHTGVSPVFITIRFQCQYLSFDPATLAAAGLTTGSTVQCDLHTLHGGVGSKFIHSDDLREKLKMTHSGNHGKYSITRKGLSEIFQRLLRIAKEERGFEEKDMTSHDCAALFQGKSWKSGQWKGEKDEKLQFHPMDRFPELYSDKMPDRITTYTWTMFKLIGHLPQFLDACEEMVPTSPNGETTYWMDILFTCQNSHDIKLYLSIADGLYSGAEFHFAFLFGGMLSRAWCNAEIVARFVAALKSLGLWTESQDRTDAIIRGGELLREGRPAFTIFVTVEGLTHLENDAIKDGHDKYSVDRFGTMQALDANEKREIQGQTLQIFLRAEAFNFMMVMVRSAVLLRHADMHPVRRAHVPPCYFDHFDHSGYFDHSGASCPRSTVLL